MDNLKLGFNLPIQFVLVGVRRCPSSMMIKKAKKCNGISYEAGRGSFYSRITSKIMTPGDKTIMHRLTIRTSAHKLNYIEAAKNRDRALHWLTDGKVDHDRLSLDYSEHCEPWSGQEPLDKIKQCVVEFKDTILDYCIAEDVFLCKEDCFKMLNRKPERQTAIASDKHIHFSSMQPTWTHQSDSGTIDSAKAKVVSMPTFARHVRVGSRNMFVSAPAGFGKTHIVKNVICPQLIAKYGERGVWITATTGIAAIDIGGVTLHSASGLQRGYGDAQHLVDQMKATQRARWRLVRAIVVDEISMLSGPFLRLLDDAARILKDNPRPFGGLQIILVGDFCQLQPVSQLVPVDSVANGPKYKRRPVQYAFEVKSWKDAKLKCYRPLHCWRYNINGRLGRFLQNLRLAKVMTGSLYEDMKALFMNEDLSLASTITLCTKKRNARQFCEERLKQLCSDEVAFCGKVSCKAKN